MAKASCAMQRHAGTTQQQRREPSARSSNDLEVQAIMSRIGDSAVQLGAIVDVVAATEETPLHARQLLQLTQRTGGTMICSGEHQHRVCAPHFCREGPRLLAVLISSICVILLLCMPCPSAVRIYDVLVSSLGFADERLVYAEAQIVKISISA